LAERLLNLVPTDVGRPIDNIRPNLKLPSDGKIHPDSGRAPDLAALIREVIDTVSLKEQEVQDLDAAGTPCGYGRTGPPTTRLMAPW